MSFAYPAADVHKVADASLGWDSRHKNPKQEYYWAEVRDAIIKPVLEANRFLNRETSKVLLHGDRALDKQFQAVLREAVEGVLPNKSAIFALDPVYSAARGAAVMAKRVYWTYNSTNHVESYVNEG